MGADKIKKSIHELVDQIEDEQILQAVLNVLTEAEKKTAPEGQTTIDLLENLDTYIEENKGLLNRLAQ